VVRVKIGFVGLGKMGLPVALAIQSRGHAVRGYDISDQRMEVAKNAGLSVGTLPEVVQADVVFVAIQTPHAPEFEGITRLPAERRDFDSTHQIALDRVHKFYLQTITPQPSFRLSSRIRDAELVKVAYNTFIGMKLAYANTMMEICHKTDCDVDFVLDAIKSATRRLISS